ncbi:MAG: hypothetical protein K2Y02_08545 [Burkholderiaceae bacterium]|nr:hypothetical protein [Burkholderiaceae bacterium]
MKSRVALPSVEVQMESLEKQGLHLSLIVTKSMRNFAAENPNVTATVYSYGNTSLNFQNEPGYSEFLVVAGNKSVLKAIGASFVALKGVKSRYSDYVAPSDCIPAYHIEDGLLWEPEDIVTWYCATDDNADEEEGCSPTVTDNKDKPVLQATIEGSGVIVSQGSEIHDGDTEQASSGGSKRVGRAARSDASVGTIRRTIEEMFGLPAGSVALCGPDGRALRGDAFIRTLRRKWGDE